MSSILPEELVASISQQWPCRKLQIRQLANLLSPSLPSPSAIVVHGPEATGKSTVLREVLNAYTRTDTNSDVIPTNNKNKRRKIENKNDVDASLNSLYAVVKVAECITARHLLTRIVSSTIAALRATGTVDEEWIHVANNAKCDHISSLPGILGELLAKAGCEKFVLVLDGVDSLREGGQMLLAALARIGEIVNPLCIVFVLRLSPRPLSLQVTGVPHVYFAPYTRAEALSILVASGPPDIPDFQAEMAAKLFGSFLSTLYDALIGPTAGTIPAFRSSCRVIWPRFVMPILNGEDPPGAAENRQWNFAKLLVKNRRLFQQQGEQAIVHRIAPEDPVTTVTNGVSKTVTKNSVSPLPSLPYISTLVLTAAFLAAHTPPRTDTLFFSKFTTSKKKRMRRRKRTAGGPGDVDDPTATPSKSSKKAGQTSLSTIPKSRGGGLTAGILTPKPFTIERLLAIYHAIDPNPPLNNNKSLPFADAVYPELATLQRLRLLVPASSSATTGGALENAEKWCLNVNVTVGSGASSSGEWIVDLARDAGVDIDEYIAALMG